MQADETSPCATCCGVLTTGETAVIACECASYMRCGEPGRGGSLTRFGFMLAKMLAGE